MTGIPYRLSVLAAGRYQDRLVPAIRRCTRGPLSLGFSGNNAGQENLSVCFSPLVGT